MLRANRQGRTFTKTGLAFSIDDLMVLKMSVSASVSVKRVVFIGIGQASAQSLNTDPEAFVPKGKRAWGVYLGSKPAISRLDETIYTLNSVNVGSVLSDLEIYHL